jgi:spore germination protein YaaH
MFRSLHRPFVVAVSLACLLGASPAVAADPPTRPTDGAAAARAQSPRTIHAEMAERMAGEAPAFRDGARPAAMSATAPGAGGGSVASVAGLPNGLGREVFGYLPYWALDSALLGSMNYDLVSTIAYFGVPARSDGTLQKTGTYWAGWTSSHMTNVINAAHAEQVKVVLTVTMMAWDGNYSAMTSLLNSPTKRTQLAAEIAATVADRNADGVNLDFEPMPNSLEDAYTAFVRDVKAALGSRYLTVATTGGAASWDEGYDLAALVQPGAADAIMAMGYDFNWGGSSRAGAVSPIDSPYVLDVRTAMEDYLDVVPASKLIWGVPYYGRAWTTQTSGLNSLTCKSKTICPTGKSAAGAFGRSWAPGYVDARKAAADHGRRWDPAGNVAWYRYQSSTYGTWVQGYYDDPQSLNVKYDLVNANGLRGVGIWHLLLDAGRQELWDIIGQNLLALPFTDIDDSIHWSSIAWIADQGITTGCGGGKYCPDGLVTRGQMATFLVRALDLPPTSNDYFTDDETSKHEQTINRLREAGITFGCTATTFCPNGVVTRGQMASFLVRGFHLPSTATDFFADDETNRHESAINRIAAAGITVGCDDDRYCPDGSVTRAQMATFLRRALTD